MRYPLPMACVALAMLGLGGCSWVALAAKETALSTTGHYGLDSFTLEGKLPAEFGMDIKPWHGPVDPQSSACQRQDMDGESSPRYHGTSDNIPIQAQPQTFTHRVPLTYSVGLCKMQLTSVDLSIKGRHGPQRWQQTYADGGFRIFKQLPTDAPGFDSDGVRAVTAECSWLFQQSQARSRFGELEKLLTCAATGTHLQYDQLAGKTVKLAIEVNPEEEPSMRNRWIKGHSGWKPCLGTEKSDRCQQPPLFKTFLMNGKTCTVYPGCTEQEAGTPSPYPGTSTSSNSR